jgi:2,4-dienoyl-CoA reductase-like NADH-dependent reductase (Old Yellow Enzyme family)/thioredoxin reductase
MSKLFIPIKIGPLTIKNRFMMAPMENGLACVGGMVNEKIISFFEERAKNEVGIILTGSVAVSPEGRGLPAQLSLYDDIFIPELYKLTNAVHNAGSLIGAQIYHAGRQATESITGHQPIAPSAIPCDILKNNPREMTAMEINEMKQKFVQAASRAIEAGFDLIELHFAHGYLLHSFLSPHSNKRTDEYGGSLENRMRFPIEVLRDIAEVCSDKVALTIRVSAEEFLPDGLKFEEVIPICQEAVKAGAQAISVSAGSYDSVQYTIQPMFIKQGILVPFSKALKEYVNVPVIVAGRLNNADLMEKIIENKESDMLAIGRGLIADEELVVKMRKQLYDDIRYCVACNQGCIDNVFQGKGINCLVNARAGFEQDRAITTAEVKKKVVIIGAGPAGMEAARVARLRGHEVLLIDKKPSVGGKIDILSALPERGSYLLFKGYLSKLLAKLGVQFIQEDITSAEDLQKYNPDSVIIATGSHSKKPKIKGADLPNVVFAEEVIEGSKEVGEHVAIIEGGPIGMKTAHLLSQMGKKVSIIDSTNALGTHVGPTYLEHLLAVFADQNVTQLVNANVVEFCKDKVVLQDRDVLTDTIIITIGFSPNDKMVADIKSVFEEVVMIGDVNQAGNPIIFATSQGFLAASKI